MVEKNIYRLTTAPKRLRTFQEKIKKFIDEPATPERCQDLQAQAEILPEAGPSRKAIDEPPTEAGPSKQQELEPPLYTPSPVSATIPRYYSAENNFWFVIHAEMEAGKSWALHRSYEDFYEFQIALLTIFPAEAGSTGTQKRTFPYMPGPVNYATDAITEGRMHNLNAYIQDLLKQPAYISRCKLVKQFFPPRKSGYEIGPEAVPGPKGEMFSKNVLEERTSTSVRTIDIHDHMKAGWDENSPHSSDALWEEYAGSRRERKGKR